MAVPRFAPGERVWISVGPADRGPEGNHQMWLEAETMLEGLKDGVQAFGNEALVCALLDAYERAGEERRRAHVLLELHRQQEEAARKIGGVQEPQD